MFADEEFGVDEFGMGLRARLERDGVLEDERFVLGNGDLLELASAPEPSERLSPELVLVCPELYRARA